eukprot:s172_g23.t1
MFLSQSEFPNECQNRRASCGTHRMTAGFDEDSRVDGERPRIQSRAMLTHTASSASRCLVLLDLRPQMVLDVPGSETQTPSTVYATGFFQKPGMA